jgi:YbgC/YbaW family acyl-CoA thioester hydrolase
VDDPLLKKMKAFEYQHTVRFRESDPAQMLFFGNTLSIVHDAYEEFVQFLGFSFDEWFLNPQVIYPLRASHQEFLRPLKPGQNYRIQVTVKDLSESTFTLQFLFLDDQQQVCCKVETVHVCVDRKTTTKQKLPSRLDSELRQRKAPSL